MSDVRFALLADTTCDLPREWYEQHDALFLPHGIVMDGKEYTDDFGATMPPEKVYAFIRDGGMPSTVQGSLEDFTRIFEECCKNGQDVLYVGFSSQLSGTFNTACMVAGEMMEKYPGRQVVCFDSRAATMGHGIQVIEAQRLREQGMTARETAAQLEKKRLGALHFFTVDDLNHLYRGGRLSKATAVVGSMLGIKPIMYVSDDGKLTPLGKKRGRRQAVEELARLLLEYIRDPEKQTIYIAHGDCRGDAEELAQLVREKLPQTPVDIFMLCPVIGVHSGPGTLAIFGWGEKRI